MLPISTLLHLTGYYRFLCYEIAVVNQAVIGERCPALARYSACFFCAMCPARNPGEVLFYPDRLMFHDTTCLPALADFAAMRDLTAELGGDARKINPHSCGADHRSFGDCGALRQPGCGGGKSARRLSSQPEERYRFIRWAEQSLDNFRVIPPGTGIIHLMNLENIAEVVSTDRRGGRSAAPPGLHDCDR